LNPCSTVSRTNADGDPEPGAGTIESELEDEASSKRPLLKDIEVALMPGKLKKRKIFIAIIIANKSQDYILKLL
jgi:hypothetical protein